MPFGLKNVPRKFQKAMHETLGNLSFCKIFLDDILIASDSKENHMKHLETVLNRLWKHGIAINWGKTNLFSTKVKYLGHILTEDQIFPDIEKGINYC